MKGKAAHTGANKRMQGKSRLDNGERTNIFNPLAQPPKPQSTSAPHDGHTHVLRNHGAKPTRSMWGGVVRNKAHAAHNREVPGSNPSPASTATVNAESKNLSLGAIVVMRYYDHVLFKDVPGDVKPVIRETVGWLDYENLEYIRLVWERYAEPIISEESRIRTTGLAIRKSDIVEMRRIK